MRFRNLRIAWSVVWIVAALWLCVVWVRSYSSRTPRELWVTPAYRYYLQSHRGTAAFGREERFFLGVEFVRQYEESEFLRLTTISGVKIVRGPEHGPIYAVCFSYWLLVLVTLGIADGPWLPSRFSLRTLLIATTLLAILLGTAAISD